MSPCNKTERTGPEGEPTSLVKATKNAFTPPDFGCVLGDDLAARASRAGSYGLACPWRAVLRRVKSCCREERVEARESKHEPLRKTGTQKIWRSLNNLSDWAKNVTNHAFMHSVPKKCQKHKPMDEIVLFLPQTTLHQSRQDMHRLFSEINHLERTI